MFQTIRANSASLRGFDIQASADDMISLTVPAYYQLSGSLGVATQVIEETTDRGLPGTVTCGAMSLGHVQVAQAFMQQEATRAAGGSPVGAYSFKLANGDTFTGLGVINPPESPTGGVASGTRVWRILLQNHTFVPAVGLAAALAAAGTV